jgi:integrase
MGRPIHKLSKQEIADAGDGLHGDGGGLYLSRAGHACSWIFRFARAGKAHDIGLGPYPEIDLAIARAKAFELRRKLALGEDILTERRAAKSILRATTALTKPAAVLKTFREAARELMKSKESAWGRESLAQWGASLSNYVFPLIGGVPVADVDVDKVLSVLKPIWETKTETASRVRGRIESILDFAKVKGWRNGGENPARWSGNLEHTLASPKKLKKATAKNFEAVPVAAVPGFMARLRLVPGTVARGLEFLMLTAGRKSEVLEAHWSEIDLAAKVWNIPGKRMKARVAHDVPLSDRAIEILQEVRSAQRGEFVFPGARNPSIAMNQFNKVMGKLGVGGATVHGLRSSFRDWCGETGQPRELAEMALAHAVGNAVEQSYSRSKLIERRRAMMQAWADYCAGLAPRPVGE